MTARRGWGSAREHREAERFYRDLMGLPPRRFVPGRRVGAPRFVEARGESEAAPDAEAASEPTEHALDEDVAAPTTKVTVPVGSRFFLKWTANGAAKVINSFEVLVKKNEGDEAKREPRELIATHEHAKGEVRITIRVERDGKPHGFRPELGALAATRSPGGKQWLFRSIFQAREPGVLLFTVTQPDGTRLTKEVTIVEPAKPLNEKRQYMLDVIDRWMPSSVKKPRPPKPPELVPQDEVGRVYADGKPVAAGTPLPDILQASGWTPAMVKSKLELQKATKALPTTSCGDVLATLLRLWGCDFDDDCKWTTRAFGIRDDGTETITEKGVTITRSKPGKRPHGAITKGYYQSASEAFAKSPPLLPSPGDVLVLRSGPKPTDLFISHVNVLVATSDELWTTANGGSGRLADEDQIAEVSSCEVQYTTPDATHPKGIPVLVSVTDGGQKLLDGWVILDKIPNPLFAADGSRRSSPKCPPKAPSTTAPKSSST